MDDVTQIAYFSTTLFQEEKLYKNLKKNVAFKTVSRTDSPKSGMSVTP